MDTGARMVMPAGMDFSGFAAGYNVAVPTSLLFLNFFNSLATLGRNLAPNAAKSVVVGEPTVSGQYGQFSSANYINLNQPRPSGDFTLLAVAAPVIDGNAFIIGNYVDAFNSAAWLYFNQATPGDGNVQLVFGTTHYSGSAWSLDALAGPVLPVDSLPRAISARYDATTRQKVLTNLTTGISYTSTPAQPMVAGGASLRIGAAIGAGAAVRVGLGGMWGKRWSDAEQASQYAQVKRVFARVGETV